MGKKENMDQKKQVQQQDTEPKMKTQNMVEDKGETNNMAAEWQV